MVVNPQYTVTFRELLNMLAQRASFSLAIRPLATCLRCLPADGLSRSKNL